MIPTESKWIILISSLVSAWVIVALRWEPSPRSLLHPDTTVSLLSEPISRCRGPHLDPVQGEFFVEKSILAPVSIGRWTTVHRCVASDNGQGCFFRPAVIPVPRNARTNGKGCYASFPPVPPRKVPRCTKQSAAQPFPALPSSRLASKPLPVSFDLRRRDWVQSVGMETERYSTTLLGFAAANDLPSPPLAPPPPPLVDAAGSCAPRSFAEADLTGGEGSVVRDILRP